MKKLLLIPILLMLSACASTMDLPEEKGTACTPHEEDGKERCWPARLYTDPVRFHYLRPWQERALPDMPDLP